MNTKIRKSGLLSMATFCWLSCWSSLLYADTVKVYLTGKEEVPLVTTTATGNGSIFVAPSKIMKGSIKTVGLAGTAAHIHSGRSGQNGSVVVTLTKMADDIWTIPEDTTLTTAAYKDFEAGNLYINVHSGAHPDGEIRSQIAVPPWLKDQPSDARSAGGGGY